MAGTVILLDTRKIPRKQPRRALSKLVACPKALPRTSYLEIQKKLKRQKRDQLRTDKVAVVQLKKLSTKFGVDQPAAKNMKIQGSSKAHPPKTPFRNPKGFKLTKKCTVQIQRCKELDIKCAVRGLQSPSCFVKMTRIDFEAYLPPLAIGKARKTRSCRKNCVPTPTGCVGNLKQFTFRPNSASLGLLHKPHTPRRSKDFDISKKWRMKLTIFRAPAQSIDLWPNPFAPLNKISELQSIDLWPNPFAPLNKISEFQRVFEREMNDNNQKENIGVHPPKPKQPQRPARAVLRETKVNVIPEQCSNTQSQNMPKKHRLCRELVVYGGFDFKEIQPDVKQHLPDETILTRATITNLRNSQRAHYNTWNPNVGLNPLTIHRVLGHRVHNVSGRYTFLVELLPKKNQLWIDPRDARGQVQLFVDYLDRATENAMVSAMKAIDAEHRPGRQPLTVARRVTDTGRVDVLRIY